MSRFLRFHAIVLVLAFPTVPVLGGEASDLEKRFWKEYPAAFQRLERFYGNCCMDLDQIPKQGSAPRRKVHYRSNRANYRIDVQISGRGEFSSVGDSERYLAVEKKGGVYKVNSLISGDSPGKGVGRLALHAILPFAAYYMLDARTVDIVTEPRFRITKSESVRTQDGRSLKIAYEGPYEDDEGKTRTRVGWFLFDPDHAWVQKGYEFATDKNRKGRRGAVITYKGESEGIPLVSSVEYYLIKGADGKRVTEEIVEAKNISTEPAPMDDLQLGAFGLSDLIGRSHPASSIGRTHVWLLLAGSLGLILALFIRKLAKDAASRKKAPTAESAGEVGLG